MHKICHPIKLLALLDNLESFYCKVVVLFVCLLLFWGVVLTADSSNLVESAV